MNYRPLPSSLTIKNSAIDGLGLFAVKRIPAERFLGIGWLKAELAHDGYWRTPLGVFINHSDTPNCIKMSKDDPTSEYVFLRVGDKDIEMGEELTVKYTFYTI